MHFMRHAFGMENTLTPYPYKRKYCETLLELMQGGAALCEVAAAIGVDMETLAHWQQAHPSFRRGVQRGEVLAEAWWSKQGREGLYDKNFKVSLWALYMKHRFNWGNGKVEALVGEGGGTGAQVVTLQWAEEGEDESKIMPFPEVVQEKG